MKKNPPYIPDRFNPERRITIPVKAGDAVIGGKAAILVQSMTNTATADISATVKQTLELARAGCGLVRYTVPTVKDVLCLKDITSRLKRNKCSIPLCADIHFQPKAAFEALKWVDKVRINPGNFADRKVRSLETFKDSDYRMGVQNIFDTFGPFVKEAASLGRCIRIGTNHGSLSDRIMYKYGNTIEGMVESALEYLRVCEAENFHQVVFSMKASNPRVTIHAYRLLAARLEKEHRNYPFHLGVTEAGAGSDGRIKSAVGIGSLLLDGIGDTIRVSLTENPVKEVPAARELVKLCNLKKERINNFGENENVGFYNYRRRKSKTQKLKELSIGGNNSIAVGIHHTALKEHSGRKPEWVTCPVFSSTPKDVLSFFQVNTDKALKAGLAPVTLSSTLLLKTRSNLPDVCEIMIDDVNHLSKIKPGSIKAKKIFWSINPKGNIVGKYRRLSVWMYSNKRFDPIILRCSLRGDPGGLRAAAVIGSLLTDGIGDMVHLSGKAASIPVSDLAFDILQAAGARRTKTEYISCPGCGRTLFDLEKTLVEVKNATSQLKDLTIGVMGCVVNGPGEMADADFGYVGGSAGKINLYVGQKCVQKNIDQQKAPQALVELIKKEGKWSDERN